MEDLKSNIAKNLAMYRKAANMTQIELAEKLNYSDKAVSKWERAEAIPDVFVLKQLADMYETTIDNFFKNNDGVLEVKISKLSVKKKIIITCLSFSLVWLVATIFFVFLSLLPKDIPRLWLAFIYAIPCSFIVLLVFSVLWSKKISWMAIVTSLLSWSVIMTIYLSFKLDDFWLIFLIGVPLQVLIVLWFLLKFYLKNKDK